MNGSLEALVATSKERMENLKEAAHQKREEVKLSQYILSKVPLFIFSLQYRTNIIPNIIVPISSAILSLPTGERARED